MLLCHGVREGEVVESVDLVIGVTGASGSIYAYRLLRVLLGQGHRVHLVLTDDARTTWKHELEDPFDAGQFNGDLRVYDNHDYFTPIASGSFRHEGMVVIPCSMKTAAEVAHGLASTLLTRAADVCLKERRKLVMVVRETPFSLIHLENLTRLSQAGAMVLPASPGFYHSPRGIADLVDFVVARVLDQVGIEHQLGRRWRQDEGNAGDGRVDPKELWQ